MEVVFASNEGSPAHHRQLTARPTGADGRRAARLIPLCIVVGDVVQLGGRDAD